MKTTTRALGLSVAVALLLSILTGCNRGPSDATITQNVEAKLKADPALATAPISVKTTEGVVTLTGEVKSEANKGQAEQLARSVEGVKSVTNTIIARPPAPVIAQDDPLRTQVMANLAKYGITTVSATIANGEVTLTGEIPRAKLQDAMKAANEARPKKVNNKLTIK